MAKLMLLALGLACTLASFGLDDLQGFLILSWRSLSCNRSECHDLTTTCTYACTVTSSRRDLLLYPTTPEGATLFLLPLFSEQHD